MKYSEQFAVVSQNLGFSGSPVSIRPCAGGCIHDSTVWQFAGGERIFVKFSAEPEGRRMLEAEFDALKCIASTRTVRCPAPLLAIEVPERGYALVLEFLELGPLNRSAASQLGEALAHLHQCKANTFGFGRDNFIGRTPQRNSEVSDWGEFFWQHRIRYQLELARSRGYSTLPLPSKIEFAIRNALSAHAPHPSLLHGDLWGGNAAALPDGTPVIFDPASYYGDRETDLAFTEMFGGFPAEFYQAYEASFPMDLGYRERKSLYNLYHYLNHLNLFGSSYLNSCHEILNNLERRWS